MNAFIKALRRLAPEEIKALLEKIDAFETLTDSSSYPTKDFVRNARLTRLERFLLRDALHRIERRDAMVHAMEIVVHNSQFEKYMVEGSVLARGLNQSISGTAAQLKADIEQSQRIYHAAEKARQVAIEQENLARKKVVVRVRPPAK